MTTDLGTDFYCDGDLTPDLRMVGGLLGVALALARRLWGSLWYDPNYGFDLRELINSVGQSSWEIESAVRSEFLKDERVEKVQCQCLFSEGFARITCVITTSTEEVFSFVVTADQLNIQMYDFMEAA